MNTQTSEVERVVRACERYWKRRRVPRDRIADMRAELEAHLSDAAAEGRLVDSVVGPDVTAFAEGWAREFRPPVGARPKRAASGPALLAFLIAMYSGWVGLINPAFLTTSYETCCPRRVVESTEDVDVIALVFGILGLSVAVFALAATVLLALGRLTGASVALGIAVVLGALQPFTWVTALALVGCFAWTQWYRRRPMAVAPGG